MVSDEMMGGGRAGGSGNDGGRDDVVSLSIYEDKYK